MDLRKAVYAFVCFKRPGPERSQEEGETEYAR